MAKHYTFIVVFDVGHNDGTYSTRVIQVSAISQEEAVTIAGNEIGAANEGELMYQDTFGPFQSG